jgi:hypothetical protein
VARAYGVPTDRAEARPTPRSADERSAAERLAPRVDRVRDAVELSGVRTAAVDSATDRRERDVIAVLGGSGRSDAEVDRADANRARNLNLLIGGTVPGSAIDQLDDQAPTTSPAPTATASAAADEAPTIDAVPFYNRPADRNAAATAIQLGRSLDVTG